MSVEFVVISFAAVAWIVLAVLPKEETTRSNQTDRFRDGFQIQAMGHGLGVFYSEPDGHVLEFLHGPRRMLLVPSEECWLRSMPDWAKHKRGQIVTRLSMREWHVGFIEYQSDEERERLHRYYRNPERDNPVI